MMISADNVAVPASLSLETVATTAWHAIIVGAGPAGAATAIRLGRAGWRVLLVDRCPMPRPKVCGCCLSPRALAELRHLDPAMVDDSLLGEVPLHRVRLVAAGRSVRLPLPTGGVLSRSALDPRLVQMAVAAGAAWLPQVAVTSVTETGDAHYPLNIACQPTSADKRLLTIQARVVILAIGLTDHVRLPEPNRAKRVQSGSRIGVGAAIAGHAVDLPTGELVMAVGRSGYCGLVRLEDGSIDVAAAIDKRGLRETAGVQEAVARVLVEADATGKHVAVGQADLAAAEFRATPPLTRAAPLVGGASQRIFRVGDAAGYVEPFTGEGIGWALTSSRLLAAALLAGGDTAGDYERSHAACFRQLHGRCRRIAAALRHPRLVGSAIRLADAAPWAATRIVPLLIGARDRGGDLP